ncbi:hypothetical protein DFH07DRAFT_849899 [Mycena maculata]|uniref:Uncharacterized protein n=1 Tax=Mycena maculata TaxID=230809 RepID=A0AAD7MS84_9AGAR|nr:hypothetical protein DFH07DRAFT_849899 [Mycena maculata]
MFSRKTCFCDILGTAFSVLLRLTTSWDRLAAICALINFICSQSGNKAATANVFSMLAIISNNILPKLYAISTLWTLNSRRNIRLARSNGQNTSSTEGRVGGGGASSLGTFRNSGAIQVRTQVQTIQRSDDIVFAMGKTSMDDIDLGELDERDSTVNVNMKA